MSKEILTPELRFEGFESEWEKRKFKQIVTRETKMTDSKKLPTVEYEDIASGEGRLMRNVSMNEKGRKGIYFEPDYILYGKLRPYLNNWLYTGFEGIALGDFWVFTALKTSPLFDFYLIQSNKYQEVANISSGTKMPRSDWKIVSNTEFAVPKDFKEQQAIGEFLKPLDKIIGHRQKQLTKLQNFKQAMLLKMFPKEGECEPNVRFDGFDDNWEECVLRDITKISTGFPFKSEMFEDDGEYLVISNTNIQDDSPYVDNTIGSKLKASDLEHLGDYILRTREILVTMDGTVGRTAIVNHPYQVLAQRVGRLTNYNNPEFLYYLLNTGQFAKKMKNISHGGTIKHISLIEIGDFTTRIPRSSEEKKLLGQYFSNLDKNIQARKAELKKLKQFKQAMLSKLFV